MPLSASNREKLKRGVGSKTEGPQTELLGNRKVSLSAPQPNFLYFLTSFSKFGLASWKNVRVGGGDSMLLGIPRLLPPLALAAAALHFLRPLTSQRKDSVSLAAYSPAGPYLPHHSLPARDRHLVPVSAGRGRRGRDANADVGTRTSGSRNSLSGGIASWNCFARLWDAVSYRRVLFCIQLVVRKSTIGGDDRVGSRSAVLGRAASLEIVLESNPTSRGCGRIQTGWGWGQQSEF